MPRIQLIGHRRPYFIPCDHLPTTGGVYQLLNTSTGESYVGAATNLWHRARKHAWGLHNRRHPNRLLSSSYAAHGAKSFRFLLLESVVEFNIHLREQHYIELLKPSFNTRKADGANNPTFFYQRRFELKLRQRGIARAMGVTEQTVGAWEKGSFRPRLTLAPKLAEVYGVPVERIEQEIVKLTRATAATA